MKSFKYIKYKIINRILYFLPLTFLDWRHRFNNRFSIKLWIKDDPFLLHVPKTGGTSISRAMNRAEPGHHKFLDLVRIYPEIESKENFYFVIRDPVDRIISTYNYVKDLHSNFGTSNLPQVHYASTLEDFVQNYLVNIDVRVHYFLRPAFSIISGAPENKLTAVCFDGLSENLNEYFRSIFVQPIALPHENKSSRPVKEALLSPSSRKIIYEIYSQDFYIYEAALRCKFVRISDVFGGPQ